MTDQRAGGVNWDVIPPPEQLGREVHDLLARIFPICRSISGDGVRATFDILSEVLSLERTEVPSGTAVFDWTVPKEWNIRDAWIDGPDGQRIVDFRDSNLHVLSYATPIRAKLSLEELRPHLFVHPTEPDWIPYRTSYYNENWGFCLTQRTLDSLQDGTYDVFIDSTLADGSITFAESVVRGSSGDEILLSTYCCHPSLANDNVSGIAFLAILGSYLAKMRLRWSYRALFSPGSIGPISWLAANEASLERIRGGLVVSCVGDPGTMTYKQSRRGIAEIDRAAAIALRDKGADHEIRPFTPLGGDERQFCSPGIDLPVGALSRTPADEFEGYHSSADDLQLVTPEHLADSMHAYLRVIDVMERNGRYLNTHGKGEPQLGKRGLYRSIGGGSFAEAALLWVLNFSDGANDLIAIAERSKIAFAEIAAAADLLLEHDLLVRAP